MKTAAKEPLTPKEVKGFKDLLKALDQFPHKPHRKTFEEFVEEQAARTD